jgi:hypothetical protein
MLTQAEDPFKKIFTSVKVRDSYAHVINPKY